MAVDLCFNICMNWKYSTQTTRIASINGGREREPRKNKIDNLAETKSEYIRNSKNRTKYSTTNWKLHCTKSERNDSLRKQKQKKNDNKKKETSARRRWIFEESFIAVQYRYGNLFIFFYFFAFESKFYSEWRRKVLLLLFLSRKCSNLSNNSMLSANHQNFLQEHWTPNSNHFNWFFSFHSSLHERNWFPY